MELPLHVSATLPREKFLVHTLCFITLSLLGSPAGVYSSKTRLKFLPNLAVEVGTVALKYLQVNKLSLGLANRILVEMKKHWNRRPARFSKMTRLSCL